MYAANGSPWRGKNILDTWCALFCMEEADAETHEGHRGWA
jgi:hypothetical protein